MKHSGLIVAFSAAALSAVLISNQTNISNNIADEMEASWQELPASASHIEFERHTGIFNVEVNRSYKNGKESCIEQSNRTHFIGIPIKGGNSLTCKVALDNK